MLEVLSSGLLLVVVRLAFELNCPPCNLSLSFLLGDGTEDDVHRLQRDTGCLGKEQSETERNDVDSGEEEEDTTLGHVNDHERSSLSDHKVPEPLGGGSSHETVVTSAVVEDLRANNPWKRTDREAVRDDEKVNHDSHANGSRGSSGSVLVRKVSVEDGTEDPKEHGHKTDTQKQRLLPAESFDTESDENTSGNNLDDTVDTTGKQSRLGTSDTDRLENNGSIVRDGVLTTPLLKGEDYESDDESDRVTLGKDFPPRGALSSLLFLLNSSGDFSVFELNRLVGDRKLSDPSEVGKCSFVLVLGGEPSRGFFEDRQEHDHNTNGDELESDGNSPHNVPSVLVHEAVEQPQNQQAFRLWLKQSTYLTP